MMPDDTYTPSIDVESTPKEEAPISEESERIDEHLPEDEVVEETTESVEEESVEDVSDESTAEPEVTEDKPDESEPEEEVDEMESFVQDVEALLTKEKEENDSEE
jgi:hypothetical protein